MSPVSGLSASLGEIPLAELERCLDNVLTRVSRLLAEAEPDRGRVIDCGREVRMVAALIRGYRQIRKWALERGWTTPVKDSTAIAVPAKGEKKISVPETAPPPARDGPARGEAAKKNRGKRLTRRNKVDMARQISQQLQKNAAATPGD